MFISQDNKQAMRNPWVLGWLGLLVTVLAVNVIFIVTAFKTTPGLVEDDYYEKGRDVEQNFHKKMEARNRLGWDIKLQAPAEILVGQAYTYHVNIVDKVGMPVKDVSVGMQAYRPSDANEDIRMPMEAVSGASGVYQVRLALPLKGIWDLKVQVASGDDELDISRRISVVAP